MDRDHDPLPDDLTEVADQLRAARTDPTPLELDGLWQTIRRRTAAGPSRTRGARVLRGHLVAMLLTVGLVFATGASAVIASTALSDGGSTTYSTSSWSDPKDAGYCQYEHPYSKTWSFTHDGKTITVSVTADCHEKTVCITVKKGSYEKKGCATFSRDESGWVWIKCDGKSYPVKLPDDD
jgi:hypothetical protein